MAESIDNTRWMRLIGDRRRGMCTFGVPLSILLGTIYIYQTLSSPIVSSEEARMKIGLGNSPLLGRLAFDHYGQPYYPRFSGSSAQGGDCLMGSPYTFNAELLNPALNPNVRIANSMADGSEVVSVSPKGTWIATVDNRQVINLSGFDQIGVAVWPTDRNSASIMRAFGCEVKIGR